MIRTHMILNYHTIFYTIVFTHSIIIIVYLKIKVATTLVRIVCILAIVRASTLTSAG